MKLAMVIADAFFERDEDAPVPPSADLALLDDALADAVDCLEEHLESLGEELAVAVFVLLRDVRHGVIDRTSARVTAEVLLRHVGAAVGIASVEPLVRFLGALAVLPDGAETYERALDPTPDPESVVEVAMAAQVEDPGRRGDLRRALHAATLIVPVLDLDVDDRRLSLQFLPVIVRDQPMISVFTSRARLGEHGAAAGIDEVPTIELSGEELASVLPAGHGVAINPGWVLGCVLDELEVRSLPHAPSMVLTEDRGDLKPGVHPSVGGALDAIGPSLAGMGVDDLVAATCDGDVVVAVVVADGTAPEVAVQRVGVALAELGLHGPVLVPSTSSMGQAVLATRR